MCLVMILVMKVFIFSKTMIICLLCPLLCGLFFFWKGAKGELSYKVKKRYKHAYLYPENLLLSPSFVYRQDGTNELSLISKILSSISLFYQNSKQRLQNFTISVYLL